MRAHEGQKKVSAPLELELRTVVCGPVWVLGTEVRTSGRAEHILNCPGFSLVLCMKCALEWMVMMAYNNMDKLYAIQLYTENRSGGKLCVSLK